MSQASCWGLAAGLAQGPLLVLVVAYSVRHGTREGVKVAIAPLITGLLIIGLAVLALTRVTQADRFLGAIAIGGATFLAYLSYESLTVGLQSAVADPPGTRSLRTGGDRQSSQPTSVSVLAHDWRTNCY